VETPSDDDNALFIPVDELIARRDALLNRPAESPLTGSPDAELELYNRPVPHDSPEASGDSGANAHSPQETIGTVLITDSHDEQEGTTGSYR